MLPSLEALTHRFHRAEFLDSDPLKYPHRFTDPWDQEFVASIAALLAYGRVRQIFGSVEKILKLMEESGLAPKDYLRQQRYLKDPVLHAWRHRVTSGEDLVSWMEILRIQWEEQGSLGAAWLAHHRADRRTIEETQNAWVESVWEQVERYRIPYRKRGLSFLLNSPQGGSCCKRWMMLFRWLVRKDDLDLGLWTHGPLVASVALERRVTPAQLVMPLDTHVARISQYLGLRKRKAVDWKAALEVTEGFRRLVPEDPVRFDFGLARLGILDRCKRKYLKEICENCDLVKVCRYAKRKK